jgi:hypothetical protein
VAIRSIASLSLSFGLVSIPIKLYSATESSAAIRFKLMAPGGARVRQQYVAEPPPEEELALEEPAPAPRPSAKSRSASTKVVDFPTRHEAAARVEPSAPVPEAVVERSAMVKGYEFEKGKFVLFTPEELERCRLRFLSPEELEQVRHQEAEEKPGGRTTLSKSQSESDCRAAPDQTIPTDNNRGLDQKLVDASARRHLRPVSCRLSESPTPELRKDTGKTKPQY